MNAQEIDTNQPPKPRKPMGWLIGLGVLLITLGVVVGLVGIGIVAKRKQTYRVNDAPSQPSTPRSTGTNPP